MDSLILELQRDAMESQTNITDLLRKALVVARKLAVPEFQEWINCELDGYEDHSIPDYRAVTGQIRAWNPYHGWIPVMMQDPQDARLLTRRPIPQPIGELASLLSDSKQGSPLQMSFPPEIERDLMRGVGVPLRPVLHIGASQIHGIIDAVRNALLNWTLRLEEDGILGEGMTFTKEEKDKAQKSSIVIENFQGILGDVQHSTISQDMTLTVKQGDFASLAKYFDSIGIPQPDVAALENAIKGDPPPADHQKCGPRVSAWIGGMVARAASGAWAIAAATGADLLGRAIAAYYGLR